MAGPSVTYTFTNATTADATEVNQNFSDIISGLTDGTKDLSINALTCAGATTLNGTVGLGNATGDTVTVTGYVSSGINLNESSGDPLINFRIGGTLKWQVGADDSDSDKLVIGNVDGFGSGKFLSISTSEITLNEDSGDIDFRVEGNGNANLLFCDAGNDRVGIGTGAPGELLHVATSGETYVKINSTTNGSKAGVKLADEGGTLKWTIYYDDSSQRIYITDGDGSHGVYIPQNTDGWSNLSDRRIKTDIIDTEIDGLDIIQKIKIRDYTKIASGKRLTGIIAQELYEAYPGAVDYEDESSGVMMGLRYADLIPPLIKALQQLSAKVATLEAQIG